MAEHRLSELVTVRGRFHRSVNLSRDWSGGRDFSEYVVTPAIRFVAEQILEELARDRGARSWSLTGPYGTGKSAFALFLADVLASRKPGHEEGRALRRRFLKGTKPFVVVLVQAERGPLLPLVLESLAAAIAPHSRSLANRVRRAYRSQKVTGETAARLLAESAGIAAQSGLGGIALIVDELGKYLEFASSRPDSEDVYVLQQLAEAAARSEPPVLFATVLHSGFADYVAQDDEVRRAEWQKVQGRFRDVPFQLPTEQLLGLTAHALEVKFANGIDRAYARRIAGLLRAPALRGALANESLPELVERCAPLHPITSLLLWPLFRSKIAQNERSLFAFLTSHEPHGFQDFLRRAVASTKHAPLYSLPELYDYTQAALGLSAFAGVDSRRWALIDHALQRVPANAAPVTREVVKSIGLLAQYGPAVGLRPSKEILCIALDDRDGVEEALDRLLAESIILYRRHSDSFGLWEGSDLDLEQAFSDARAHLSRAPIAERLEQVLELRPLVARAHYVKSGTLRYFEPRVAAPTARSLKAAFSRPTVADGRIVFLIDQKPIDSRNARSLSKLANDSAVNLIAVPRVAPDVARALEEFECWQWVRDHVKELDGDSVARQEVDARLDVARTRLEQMVGPIFGACGHPLDPSLSTWYYNGNVRRPSNPRDFQDLISRLCEEAFPAAPKLLNELLNRHSLSSAAAKARRNLLERLVAHAQQPRLGLEGYPPEYSMYVALVEAGGFHRGRGKRRRLGPPSNPAWKPTWEAIEEFLFGDEQGRRPIRQLIDVLKRPPFGLRDGPIPVVLGIALLVYQHEVAIYEDGVFVPELTIEVLERLTRRPETFEVRSYRLTPEERAVLRRLARLSGGDQAGESALLDTAKALVRLAASLPPYARQTRRIAERTRAFREVLLNARDPRDLLFEEIPRALGAGIETPGAAELLADRVRDATVELSRAYDSLLEEIEEAICTAFGLACRGHEARKQLAARAEPLVPFATERRLQLFVREAAKIDERDWREVLGRAIADGKPPAYWQDADADSLGVRLRVLAEDFDRMEEAVAVRGDARAKVVSISVLDPVEGERRHVVSCPAELSEKSARLADELARLLEVSGVEDPRTQLLALASLVRQVASSARGGAADR